MFFLGQLIHTIVGVYILIVIVEVALSWLIALDVVNADNEAAKNLGDLLKRFTEPAYKHLRKYIPPVGGIDMSPLILIIGVQLIASVIVSLVFW